MKNSGGEVSPHSDNDSPQHFKDSTPLIKGSKFARGESSEPAVWLP